MNLPWLIIDFDSTFVAAESLELLGEISLAGHPDRSRRLAEIRELTDRAMAGRMPFAEALARRLALVAARAEHIGKLVAVLRQRVSPSFRRNARFLRAHAERLYVVSSGFHEYIDPVVAEFGITSGQVLANRFVTRPDGTLGVDSANPLAADGGKVEAVRRLRLAGAAVAVGDGVSDRELADSRVCERFYAYVETVRRPEAFPGASSIVEDFDAVLNELGLSGRAKRALLLENIHSTARDALAASDLEVEIRRDSPDRKTLGTMLDNVAFLGIRSKTQITGELLDRAPHLLAIGAYCIGVNQIDLEACTQRGIAVFNAPFSNTRSVAELALAEVILLFRNLPDKIREMHSGRWRKSAAGSHEVRGKTLGIIGYGKIGVQLSVLAEAAGMQVCYFDLKHRLALGNATRCSSLDELLGRADVISVHVDGRAGNRNLIGEAALARMQPGAIILNLSRGHVVDIEALDQALADGRVGGAALDVFPEEPASGDAPFACPLARRPNVILTPHIGGSTEEAQLDIAKYVSGRFVSYLCTGASTGSVNVPELASEQRPGTLRIAHLHENVPGMLAAIDRILAERSLNIAAQHLATTGKVGYALTDIEGLLDEATVEALGRIPHTLRSRRMPAAQTDGER